MVGSSGKSLSVRPYSTVVPQADIYREIGFNLPSVPYVERGNDDPDPDLLPETPVQVPKY